jgi:MOSC domain-containing protein YiiM
LTLAGYGVTRERPEHGCPDALTCENAIMPRASSPTPIECPTCRFRADAYTDQDVAGTLRALGPWWQVTKRDRTHLADRRPAPDAASAIEHAVATIAALEGALELTDAAMVAASPTTSGTPTIDELVATLADTARALEARPERGARRAAIHDALHRLHLVGRGFHALGAGTPPHTGTVERINVSRGGVPKHAVPHADIAYRGIVGDRQGARRHHGRVFQALCLWSADVIDRLHGEGHPIAAGSAGENLTLRGVDWAALRPGTELRIGSARAVITVPAVPCAKNAVWFADRDFGRIHHDRNPADPRWYAAVLADGQVREGDPVEVESSG